MAELTIGDEAGPGGEAAVEEPEVTSVRRVSGGGGGKGDTSDLVEREGEKSLVQRDLCGNCTWGLLGGGGR